MSETTWTQDAGMSSPTEADNVENYSEQAEASKDAAAASATASATSASSASGSASTATTKASEGAASATASATSASASQASRVASEAAKVAAETAKTATETARDAASASEVASGAAEVAAETAETNAAASAAAALSSKNAAATSATTASTKATESATSAAASEASNVAAGVAKVAAETAEANAETAQTASETARTASEAAKVAAETAETNASTSAATATTQAGIATTKAGEAATSATASASSATASEAAKDAALAALDSFDDRYLGAKASDPTVDNDGNALVSGALYFNTTDDTMKVYEGSQWVAAYASLSGALLAANNLSDLASASAGRTNLGLGTAATTASTDYATAAQGALAASATQPGDLATVATSGAYSDLSGTPSPFDPSTLATVATSGAYSDLSGTPTLGTAASTASTDYATAAQGTLAASATQPGDLATVATSGAYSDLSGTPTLGTAASSAATDFVAVTGDTMTGNLDVQGTVTADGLTVDGSSLVNGSGTITSGGSAGIDTRLTLANTGNGGSGRGVALSLSPAGSSNSVESVNLIGLQESVSATANNSSFVAQVANSSGTLTQRLRINNGGDLSLYDSTGTTPKFFWDASAESLGIGTSLPTYKVDVAGTNPALRLKSSAAFGYIIDQNTSSGLVSHIVYENVDMRFGTNSTERMRLDSSGNVGIGVTPSRKFHVVDTSGGNVALFSNNVNADLNINLTSGVTSLTPSTGTLAFGTTNAERMRLDSNGALLLGATSRSIYYNSVNVYNASAVIKTNVSNEVADLVITNGNNDFGSSVDFARTNSAGNDVRFAAISAQPTNTTAGSEAGVIRFYTKGTGDSNVAERMRIDSSGNLLVGTTSGSDKVTVNGTVSATNFNTTSDATLKTNVETLTGSLDVVKSLRGVSFDWIENGNSEVGFIAQEVEEVVPEVVSTNDQGIKSVKYGNMVALLIEAMKEQQLRIEALEAKLGE